MAVIVTRETGGTAKGSPLTNAELDNNFININNELGSITGSLQVSETAVDVNPAVAGIHYVVTAANVTITLPAAPSAGDIIAVSGGTNIPTNIMRNGNLLAGVADDILMDTENIYLELQYVGTGGWRIIVLSSEQSLANVSPGFTLIEAGATLPDPAGYSEGSVFLVTGA